MKINKKGFSLVELVITVAIIAVVTGLVTVGIGSLTGMKARSCTDKLLSYMDETKTNALGFDDVKLKIYQKSDNSYWVDISRYSYEYNTATGAFTMNTVADDTTSYSIGDSKVEIKVIMQVPVGDTEVAYNVKTSDVVISFDRSAGAFNKAIVYDKGAATIKDNSRYIEKLEITQGSRKYTIKCVKLTGKFYLE